MVLDDICNSTVYSANAFHVLGLPVNVNGRKIRRRQEDVIDGLSVMGENAWNAEFDRYLLGQNTAPIVETARSLIDRLKNDPEFFATEMFFWVWPQSGGSDPAIEAIMCGERDKAVRCWQADCSKPGSRGLIARHNLAVVLHFYAVDGEDYIRTATGNIDAQYFKAVDQFWKEAFSFWEDLADDDDFWDAYAARVKELNDPRLNDEFIEKFRERLPVCFDNINADFMISYAQAGKIDEAKRHFAYMVSTMRGADDVEETLARAFKPMVDKARVLLKQCAGVKEPKKVLAACRDVLSGSRSLVSILRAIIPEGNAFTKGIINEIVTQIDNRLPDYSRATGDYWPCLKITEELLGIAATPMMEVKIRKSVKEWEDLVRQDREANTCCVCGKFQKGMPTKPLKLYRDVSADPTTYGRVQWRTRTVQVPICPNCDGRHSVFWTFETSAQSVPFVKQLISDGWKIGEKPSQKEMEAVRFL